MSESYVDLTYRGLSLGRRIKLSDVRPTTGFIELPAPMPVGTPIAVITDDTVALDAVVVGVREQVASQVPGGPERAPGMIIKPKLDGDAAKTWWKQRVTLPEVEKPAAPPPPVAPPQVVVVQKRVTAPGIGVPELVDDGQDTGVMDAIDPDSIEATPKIIDDGKQTSMMDAVDLEALGLDPNAKASGEIPTFDPDEPEPSSPPPSGGVKKKRKKR